MYWAEIYNGNKYVLTLSRFTSGCPFAIPKFNVKFNVRSKTITDKLSELFCSIGIPKTLVLFDSSGHSGQSYLLSGHLI